MQQLALKIRIFFALLLLIMLAVLFYYKIVPSGRITYEANFYQPNYFISKITPQERAQTNNGEVVVTGNPVYFSLFTPRPFDRAKLTLEYQDNGASGACQQETALIEAGILVDKTLWRYDLQSIENKVLTDLMGRWNYIQEGNKLLIQKEKKYTSIDNFLKQLPNRSEIALYNYNLKNDYAIANYQPSKDKTIINQKIRGAYQIYTYIQNEDLNFNFDFSQILANQKNKEVLVYVYHDGALIFDQSLQLSTTKQTNLALKLLDRAAGVYKIEIKADKDLITNKITTQQSKLSFAGNLWLMNDNSQFYTDSQNGTAVTTMPGSLQAIKIGSSALNLNTTYQQFTWQEVATKIKKVMLAKGDVNFSGDGVFSFTPESLINPEFKKVGHDFILDNSSINYVLATYNGPQSVGAWKLGTAEFDLRQAYQEKGKYSFLISVPELKMGGGCKIRIKNVKMELVGKSVWDILKNKFSI